MASKSMEMPAFAPDVIINKMTAASPSRFVAFVIKNPLSAHLGRFRECVPHGRADGTASGHGYIPSAPRTTQTKSIDSDDVKITHYRPYY
jgi:hypothetical protein